VNIKVVIHFIGKMITDLIVSLVELNIVIHAPVITENLHLMNYSFVINALMMGSNMGPTKNARFPIVIKLMRSMKPKCVNYVRRIYVDYVKWKVKSKMMKKITRSSLVKIVCLQKNRSIGGHTGETRDKELQNEYK
jgi:hypothetical protein